MSNLSRRSLLQTGVTFGPYGIAQALWPSWLPRVAFARNGVAGDVIVCVFLRGGADGLNMVVPFGDPAYYQARPVLAIPPPDSHDANRALPLDDFFGLNPDMRSLHDLFLSGRLTAIHAAGAPHVSRSHFEAMDLLERGLEESTGADSGWLGRHLMATAHADDSPLRAIGWDEMLPTSLRGYVSANAFRSISDYHLNCDHTQVDQLVMTLATLYQDHQPNTLPALNQAAQATIDALGIVRQIDVDQYHPANKAVYTGSDFGRGLKQTAALIKAGVGLEVACIDHGNFDTHILQGVTVDHGVGSFPQLVREFSDNMRAFHDDLADYMSHVTVVVMSEFGRRVQENGAGGTDHGRGGVMYVMNEHLAPKPVVAEWTGLNPDFLADGDLQITIDYRDVLAELLSKRTADTDLSSVFPGHVIRPVGLFRG